MENYEIISQKLEKIGKKVYIVGGWCREKLLGEKYSGDIDLATDATPEEMQKVLKVIKEVGKKYGTLIVSEGNEVFEITTFRSDIGILNNRKPVKVKFSKDLNLDSKRRDLSFNAIYFDIKAREFIDPENGINDLKNREISFVGNDRDRIEEDALRIMRYIRFKHKYGFRDKNTETKNIIKSQIHLLKNISIERIIQEFEKILLLKNNTKALDELMEIGFFKEIIPEINNLKLTKGGKPHHLEGNVWIHTLMVIEEFNKIINSGNITNNYKFADLFPNFSTQDKLIIYWSILFHDISKFETFSVDENGGVHYFRHEDFGAIKFLDISKNMKFSNDYKKIIHYLIKSHLRIFKIFEMKKLKSMKFMLEKYFKYLIILGICDNNGRIPAKYDQNNKLLEKYFEFIDYYKTLEFYNGNEIIKKYPDLKGFQIKNMIELKNNEILLGKVKILEK